MLVIKWTVIVVLALVISAIAAGQAGLLQGKPPTDLGVQLGKLKKPSLSPNSISSQANLYSDHPQLSYASIAPLGLRGDGPATVAKLKQIVQNTPGAKLITSAPNGTSTGTSGGTSGDNYLYAQYTSPLMKYVDDVEFWFDPSANVIQVRSASRLGQSDLGANRKRIEGIRAALASAP